MAVIKGDMTSFKNITDAFSDAAKSYEKSYDRLTELTETMGQSEDFAGLPGKLLIDKYKEKQDTFEELYKVLRKCTDKMDQETSAFGRMLGAISDGMR